MASLILITLKSGWRLDAEDGSLRRVRKRLQPALPPGARLRAALAPASAAPQHPWPAERELARHRHLLLPQDLPLIETLLEVRRWPFVERAELPPLTAV